MDSKTADLPLLEWRFGVRWFHSQWVERDTVVGDGHYESMADDFEANLDFVLGIVGVSVRDDIVKKLVEDEFQLIRGGRWQLALGSKGVELVVSTTDSSLKWLRTVNLSARPA